VIKNKRTIKKIVRLPGPNLFTETNKIKKYHGGDKNSYKLQFIENSRLGKISFRHFQHECLHSHAGIIPPKKYLSDVEWHCANYF